MLARPASALLGELVECEVDFSTLTCGSPSMSRRRPTVLSSTRRRSRFSGNPRALATHGIRRCRSLCVAHDFNNLLTVISGNLEMLEGRLNDPEHREILNEAQEASKLGAELAKRLLAFGRRQPLNPKPTDLNALAGGMVELLRRSLGEAVEIETRLAEGLPMTMADPGQVENALLNLAINARDAMPNGGRLVIETARAEIDKDYAAAYADLVTGRYITLAVTDTGTGMSPEVRQRAFEPFYTTKGPGLGSGLGLSMVYGFVKQSGGHVQLYSELGHGTTVRLYLPEHAGDANAEEQLAAVSIARAALGKTVLVVEDDQRVRRVSVRRLKELGYAVIEADSGSAALLVINREEPIDVLFTDIVMPGGITGIDLAHEARRRRPELKILFTSGYAEPAAVKGSITTNVSWLGKPHSINELDAKLRELLAQ
jgi:nitrogen-specific signal transduction histidine kinase/CheY-like chemotaxis protein